MSGTLDLHARLRAAIAQQDMEAATTLLRQAAALYTDGGNWAGAASVPVEQRTLRPDELVPYLELPSDEAVEAACELLGKLLTAIAPATIHAEYQALLLAGLNSGKPVVRQLALKTLQRCVAAAQEDIEIWTTVLAAAVDSLGEEDTSVAMRSQALFKILGATSRGAQLLFAPTLKQAFDTVARKGVTEEMRVYELYVRLAAAHANALDLLKKENALEPLLACVLQPRADVLWNLNALELLKTLMQTPHGYKYLRERSFLDALAAAVQRWALDRPNDADSSIVLPAILELLGCAWQVPDIDYVALDQKQPFAGFLIQLVEQKTDLAAKVVERRMRNFDRTPFFRPKHAAVSALFDVMSHGSGMQLVLDQHTDSLPTVGRWACVGESTELHVQVLHGVGLVLARRKDSSELVQRWFAALQSAGSKLEARLMELLASPFDDINLGAIAVATGLAQHGWGQRTLMHLPGFYEYLLDRHTAVSHDIQLAKFALVKAMSESQPDVLDAPQRMKLRIIVREGPFAADSEPSVAVGWEA